MDSRKKGKAVTTSVPSISIRFNANAEEIEEFYISEDDLPEEKTDAAPAATEQEGSPLRSYLPRIGKRSTSVDVSPSNTSQDASPPSDPWRFFSDIKGKITKSVEGKLTEYKNTKNPEEGSPKTQKPTASPSKPTRDASDPKDSSSKENTPSDSEDISESSISRTCGILSTTEGVEMSSDDETPSLSDTEPKNCQKDPKNYPKDPKNYPKDPKNCAKDGKSQQKDLGSYEKDSKALENDAKTVDEALASQATPTPASKHHITIVSSKTSTKIPFEDLENLQSLSSVGLENDDDEIEDGVDVLVSGVSDSIENLNRTLIDDCLEYNSIDGSELRETFLSDSELDRTIFAPTGFVDMRHMPLVRSSWKSYLYTARSLLVIVLGLILYFWAQFPLYLSGFIAGSLATLSVCLLYYIFRIRGLIIDEGANPEKHSLFIEIPAVKEYAPLTKFEGWVNEFPEAYNPHTYHVSQTQSVFVKLQGNLLKVSHTRSKIPKRAIWNEQPHKPVLTHHRIYNLLGAQISILPDGLARKRRWSKKYPIGITLSEEQLQFTMSEERMSSTNHRSGARLRKPGKTSDTSDNSPTTESNPIASSSQEKDPETTKKDPTKKETAKRDSTKYEPTKRDSTTSKEATPDKDAEKTSERGSFKVTKPESDSEIDLEDIKLKVDPLHNLKEMFENLEDKMMSLEDKVLHANDDNIQRDIAHNASNLREDMEEDWKNLFDVEDTNETRLYFFGRTDREKEDWFRRFVAATHKGAFEKKPEEEVDHLESVSSTLIRNDRMDDEYRKYMQLFHKVMPYIKLLRLKDKPTLNPITRKVNQRHEQMHKQVYEELYKEVSGDMFWVNALLGRVLYDCMRDPDFTQKVKDRIQRKLTAIKLPYFIDELIITELSLGSTPPLMHKAGTPTLDDRGLWIDLDFTYEGLIVLTLNTKVNLLKLKDKPVQDTNKIVEMKNLAMFHSDVDDSAETSSDDDETKAMSSTIPIPAALDAQGMPIQGLGGTSNASKKFIRIVDKIADSKMFKAASEYKYIKKLMEGVSNTELGLKVEVKALAGTLVLNIPPPPSDRVWVSFRPTPKLLLTAFPIVGERNITFMHVTSWIEQKLVQEFHKVLVVPNMEDMTIPVMCSTIPK